LSSFLCRESARVREKERERAREESAREREREHTRTRSRTSCTGASRALADGCHPPLWIAPALGYSCSAKTHGVARAASSFPLVHNTLLCRSAPVWRMPYASSWLCVRIIFTLLLQNGQARMSWCVKSVGRWLRRRARERERARARERESTRTRSRTSCTGASRALADGCHPPLWIAPALGYSCSAQTRKGCTRRLELSTGSQHIAVSLRTGMANAVCLKLAVRAHYIHAAITKI
jgi:hypothetical protein